PGSGAVFRSCSSSAPLEPNQGRGKIIARYREIPRTRTRTLLALSAVQHKAPPMNIDLIPVGDDPPNSLNVIIEVPVGGEPVKYEFDKKSGALFVDRILHTPMRY